MASVIARRSGDRMLADLRKQLADVLTPERYDPERAAALQQAITEWLDRSARGIDGHAGRVSVQCQSVP